LSSPPQPRNNKDNHEWEECTIDETTIHDASPQVAATTRPPVVVVDGDNNTEWEEYTIQETTAPNAAPLKADTAAAAAAAAAAAFGNSRMFSNFDPQSSSICTNNNHDNDDEVSTEQYIHCPCDDDGSVVSAFTMEPSLLQHKASWKNQYQQQQQQQQSSTCRLSSSTSYFLMAAPQRSNESDDEYMYSSDDGEKKILLKGAAYLHKFNGAYAWDTNKGDKRKSSRQRTSQDSRLIRSCLTSVR